MTTPLLARIVWTVIANPETKSRKLDAPYLREEVTHLLEEMSPERFSTWIEDETGIVMVSMNGRLFRAIRTTQHGVTLRPVMTRGNTYRRT